MANSFYRDHPEPLLLLVLDPARLGAEVRWEPAPGFADPFPHIYGPIPAAAVLRAVPLDRGPDGQFAFPPLAGSAEVRPAGTSKRYGPARHDDKAR